MPPAENSICSAAEQRDLRERREKAAAKILDQHPDTGPRELARRIAMATSRRYSESTAATFRATVLARLQHQPDAAAIPTVTSQ